MPEGLIQYIAGESHRKNEKSGGRIVRRMLTDWVEANVQKTITEQPAEYCNCSVVEVEWIEGKSESEETDGQPPPKPEVRIIFRKDVSSGGTGVHRNL